MDRSCWIKQVEDVSISRKKPKIGHASLSPRAYLRGGGSGGSNPPPPPHPKFSDFFLKSEGKEIERKRKKGMLGGGGVTS